MSRLIRGTTADVGRQHHDGARSAHASTTLAIAMAARNSGGLVIAQVERIAAAELRIRVSGISAFLLDGVAPGSAQNHLQTYGTAYSHAYSGRQARTTGPGRAHGSRTSAR